MAQQKVPGEIEFGLGRLFWVCMRHVPVDTEDSSFFSTDDVLVYDPYYGDFGPLNIAQVCRYCRMLDHKIKDAQLQGKRIYHACKPQTTRRNSILLCACWSLISNGKNPQQAYAPFVNVKPALVPYRDASLGPPSYPITVQHCLTGLAMAIKTAGTSTRRSTPTSTSTTSAWRTATSIGSSSANTSPSRAPRRRPSPMSTA